MFKKYIKKNANFKKINDNAKLYKTWLESWLETTLDRLLVYNSVLVDIVKFVFEIVCMMLNMISKSWNCFLLKHFDAETQDRDTTLLPRPGSVLSQ